MPVIKTLKNGVWTPVNSVTSLGTATPSTAGLMSASDKEKLDKTEARTLLWTNPNPSSSFASQTLTIAGLTDYDYVEIETAHITTFKPKEDMKTTIAKCPANTNSVLDYVTIASPSGDYSSIMFITRSLYFDKTQGVINFGDAYFRYTTSITTPPGVSNGYLVPYKIYGVKE